ncbi:hypothetical protein HRbin01_01286 [archaeon HR01]|nr:hypothetical protein HRbin01_01286 [archaeon HR01]
MAQNMGNEDEIVRTRQIFYKNLYLLLKLLENRDSKAIPILEKIKELECSINPEDMTYDAYCEIPNLLGRIVRKDLDPAARRLYPMALEEFYRNAGYEQESEKPDHITTMLAFMIQLLNDEEEALLTKNIDEINKIRRIQHRFLNIHLIPLLENYEQNTPTKQLIKCIGKYLKEDLQLLHFFLTKQTSR